MKAKKLGAAAFLAAALILPLSACANSGDSGSGGETLSKDEACTQIKDAVQGLSKQAPPTSADQVTTMFTDLTGKLDEISGKAPEEVKTALDKVNEAFKNLASDPTSTQLSEISTLGEDLGNVCPTLKEGS